jgi:hypothetical protein
MKGLGNRFGWYVSQKYSSNIQTTWTCSRLDGNGAALVSNMYEVIVKCFKQAKEIAFAKQNSVETVWKSWFEILKLLNSLHLTPSAQHQLQLKISEFESAFRKAFGEKSVTTMK